MACLFNNFAIQYFIGLSTLIIRLHAKQGQIYLQPRFYEPPSVQSYANKSIEFGGPPQMAQIELYFGGKVYQDVVWKRNDSRDSTKAWIEFSNSTEPRSFTSEDAFLNPVPFTRPLRKVVWMRCSLYSMNGTEKKSYFSEMVIIEQPGFIWKPLLYTFTTASGCKLSFSATTICDKGWYGVSCDVGCTVTEPNSTECDPMGKIVCKDGYDGIPCEDVDECHLKMCRHGATCINTVGSFYCICTAAFAGKQCSIPVDNCKPNPCLNGGTCSNTVFGFQCFCAKPTYEGLHCEKKNIEVITDNDVQKSVAVVMSFSIILMAAGTLLFLVRTYLLPHKTANAPPAAAAAAS